MVEYSFDRAISPENLQPLLRQTGWAHGRDLVGIRRMLDATTVMLGAWDDDRLVGYARAVTDALFQGFADYYSSIFYQVVPPNFSITFSFNSQVN